MAALVSDWAKHYILNYEIVLHWSEEVLLLFKIEDGRHLVSWDILDFSRTTACHVTRIDGYAPLEVLEGFPGHWLTKISRTTAFQVTRIDRHAPLEVPEGFPGHWLAKISRTTACHVTEIDRHVPLEVPAQASLATGWLRSLELVHARSPD
jgi:hypothetical protein